MKYVYKSSQWITYGDTVEIPDNAICIEFDVINRMNTQQGRMIQDRRVQWLEPLEENMDSGNTHPGNTHPELRVYEIFVGNTPKEYVKYLTWWKTIRFGTEAYNIKGEIISGYLPYFVQKKEWIEKNRERSKECDKNETSN